MNYIAALTGSSAEISLASVRGLTAVSVAVEDVVSGDELNVLDAAEQAANTIFNRDMKTLVKGKLQERGMTVLPDLAVDGPLEAPIRPILYVAAYLRKTPFVSTKNGETGYIAVVILELVQMVSVKAKPGLALPAPTWSVQSGAAATKADMPAALAAVVSDLLEEFFKAVQS